MGRYSDQLGFCLCPELKDEGAVLMTAETEPASLSVAQAQCTAGHLHSPMPSTGRRPVGQWRPLTSDQMSSSTRLSLLSWSEADLKNCDVPGASTGLSAEAGLTESA